MDKKMVILLVVVTVTFFLATSASAVPGGATYDPGANETGAPDSPAG